MTLFCLELFGTTYRSGYSSSRKKKYSFNESIGFVYKTFVLENYKYFRKLKIKRLDIFPDHGKKCH